tara:strand:- start:1772 stop:2518 length:747 start_codon:yes stop_codon:yes gene_type:complete
MAFNKSIINLQNAISLAIKHNIDLNKKPDREKSLYDYDEKQKIYYLDSFNSNLKLVKSDYLSLTQLTKHDIRNQQFITQILELMPELDSKDLNKLDKTLKKIISITKQLSFPKQDLERTFNIPTNLPIEISSDIKADITELNKCFNNNCYRSAIILCGRLLETALHRKYYEVTNNDLLEKSPGIGLGNIIAKLKEKNTQLDPAITNQIHLINQVRIFSVHKKKQAFYPTKQQTHAAILYTLDILEKLF